MKEVGNYKLGILIVGLCVFQSCGSGGGGTGSNSSPAKITQTFPANGAVQVPENITIEAQFSEDILPSSITPASFIILRKGSQVPGQVGYDSTNRKAIFVSSQTLDSQTIHQAFLTSAIKDIHGKPLAPYNWSFITLDSAAPTVLETSPLSDVHSVTLDSPIQANFSEDIDPSTINAQTFVVQSNGQNVEGLRSYSEKKATFIPSEPFTMSTTYTATLTTGIHDQSGNALAQNYSWSFQTITPPGPVVNWTIPDARQQEVDIYDVVNNHPTYIEAHFSLGLDSTTVNDSTFIVKDEFGTQLTGNVEYFANGQDYFARFTPTGIYSILAIDINYTATLSGMQDSAGAPLTGNFGNDYVWSFHTRSGLGLTTNCEGSDSDAQNPQILFNAQSNLFQLVWQQTSSTNPNFSIFMNEFLLYPDPATAVQISTGTGNAINPKMAIGLNGEVFVTWQQKLANEQKYSIMFNQNLGQGWGTPQVLDTYPTEAQNQQIAVGPSGFPCVVWDQEVPGNTVRTSIFFTQFIGGSWLTPVAVEIPVSFQIQAGSAKNPRIIVDQSDNVIITFLQATTIYLNNGNVSANGDLGPNNPTGPMIINTTFPYGGYPSTVYPASQWTWDLSDSLIVTESIWGQLGQPAQQFWQVLDNFGTNPQVSVANNVTYYSLAESQGKAVVCYQQKTGAYGFNFSIFSSSRSASGGWWQGTASTVIDASSTPVLSCVNPVVVIDNSGTALCTWRQSSPVYSNLYDIAFMPLNGGGTPTIVATATESVVALLSNVKIAVAPNNKVLMTYEVVLDNPSSPGPRLKLRTLEAIGWSAPLNIDTTNAPASLAAQMAFMPNSHCRFVYQQKLSPITNKYNISTNSFYSE